MYVLGVIPARGGSKGIPGKNLAPVAGKPLIAWTIEAARASRRLSRTVVSTDDPAIAREALRLGAGVPGLRPASLAEDHTPMLPVLAHALAFFGSGGGIEPDAVVLLQPTSPLRTAAHIDAAIDLLEATGADSVVSVVEVPHQFNPVSVMTIAGDRLVPFGGQPTVARRQDKPRVFARNGPAVLAVRRQVLIAAQSLYGEDCRPLVMTPEESIDVDSAWELEVVDWLLRRRLASEAGR
ncbi:MAG: acylneuraminate cytidylyltransferase family protein [Acidobacteria bacterium]|nr:acylneuraminate cytidylyltransferase family protein [Acidobacteriota bacterium]